MESSWTAEVCVLGGGPAGASLARRLALLGHDVCLVERSAFPRPHVGESLAPGIVPLLDTLGVRDRVERAGFLRPDRTLVRWSGATDAPHWRAGIAGFQVDRGRFDALLLDAAREAGVRVLLPVRALRPSRESPDRWMIPVHRRGRIGSISAAFLADATGRRALTAGAGARTAPPTIALYAYWRGISYRDPATRIEAGPDHWFWGAPLPDGTFNATVFLDPKRCTAAGRNGLDALYRSLLAGSALLRGCLDGVPAGPVAACDATSRAAANLIDARSIRVGEAAFTIDPLSSQGVQAALASALQGALAVHTLLRQPGDTPAALAFYAARQAEAVARHRDWAARSYAGPHPFAAGAFWTTRAAAPATPPDRHPGRLPTGSPPRADLRVALSEDARLTAIAAAVGDFITEVPALDHPALDRPVAFLDGRPLAPLLSAIGEGMTAGELVGRWARGQAPEACVRLFSWLWSRGIIVASR